MYTINPSIPAPLSGHRLVLAFILLLFSSFSFAENYWWSSPYPNSDFRHASMAAACSTLTDFYASDNPTYSVESSTLKNKTETSAYCEIVLYKSDIDHRRHVGNNVTRRGDGCPMGQTYDFESGRCLAPQDLCSTGQFWDFESESCKWPEDDSCPSGSNWSPAEQDCVCAGDGILSNSLGFKMCLPPAEGSCDSNSPDFAGYFNGKPYCSGRARCPSGQTLTGIRVGDALEHVCVPNQNPPDDPDCPDGQSGSYNGQKVCIPKPDKDPSCPSGQAGTVNGQKVCIPKPGEGPDCKAGETAGFIGTGPDMNPVCISKDYKPQTCPAGSYSLNIDGGFACVHSKGEKPADDGTESGNGKGGSSDKVAKGEGTTKDANGNPTGSFNIDIKLPDGLLQDIPNTDYKAEMDAFVDSQLEDFDSQLEDVLDGFEGDDGAFAEKDKLDQFADYWSSLFGSSAACSTLTIMGNPKIEVSCDDLNKIKRLLGWMLYIATAYTIFGIFTRSSQ